MTVLSIIRDTMGRLSLTRPAVVVTSTDTQVIQFFELLKESARAMSKLGTPGWQSLQASWTFLTVAQVEQTNTPIPEDFGRFVPNSFFNRTTERPISGPLTPQQYQLIIARPALANVYLAFREREGHFLIQPVPSAGDTIAYEYMSKYWAKSSAGVAKPDFTSDDDTTFLDEELLKLDLRWRWKEAKGLDYGEDMNTAEREIAQALGNDGGSTMLNMGGPAPLPFPERLNLPDGGFGLY